MLRRWAIAVGVAGCATPDPAAARAAWLRDTLVNDNRVFLSREPSAVAEKWAAMAAAPYDFLRGGLGVWLADARRPDASRLPTSFLRVPDATAVLVFGDAHPENLSTTRPAPSPGEPEPPVSVEIVDLDAAQFGPWLWDLRRAGAGVGVLFAPLDADTRASLTDALVDGWHQGFAAGDAKPTGVLLGGLVAEALDEGPENKRTAKYTLDTSGGPRLDRAADPRLQRPDSRDWAFLESLLPALDLPGGAVVHDVAARRGAGISSLPALRYWVLIGPAGGPATDILDLREVIDPPAYPRALVPGPGWEGHPGRLAAAEGHLWSRPDADPHAQALGAGGLVFKVLTRSSWQQDLDRADVEEALASQDLDLDGARGLATDLGRVLGAGHRRSILADGRPAAPAIQADLDSGGGLEVLRAELRAVVAEDTATIAADTRILSSLLHEYGPLLGAESLPTEAP